MISTVACKGSFCAEVLTSFYCRFLVEEGQFINSKSLQIAPPHLRLNTGIDPTSDWSRIG